MELEFFCKPGTDLEWFAYWKEFCINWLKSLGIKDDEDAAARDRLLRRSCASTARLPRTWSSCSPSAGASSGNPWHRTDYDGRLPSIETVSGQDMSYFDDEAKEKYIPYVIEPSLGADRVTLAFLAPPTMRRPCPMEIPGTAFISIPPSLR